MQKRQWLGLAVVVAVVVIGSWSAARLMYGRPHWSSIAAVGSDPAKKSAPGAPAADAAKAAPGAPGDACCPSGTGNEAVPAAAPEKPGAAADSGCPFTSEKGAAKKGAAESGSALPPGHPPVEGMGAGSPHGKVSRSADYAMGASPHGGDKAGPAGADACCPAGTTAAAASAKDPVCGMAVQPASAAATLKHEGKAYYFCNTGCRDAFKKNPGKYL